MPTTLWTEIRAWGDKHVGVLHHLDTEVHTVLVHMLHVAVEIKGAVRFGETIEA